MVQNCTKQVKTIPHSAKVSFQGLKTWSGDLKTFEVLSQLSQEGYIHLQTFSRKSSQKGFLCIQRKQACQLRSLSIPVFLALHSKYSSHICCNCDRRNGRWMHALRQKIKNHKQTINYWHHLLTTWFVSPYHPRELEKCDPNLKS